LAAPPLSRGVANVAGEKADTALAEKVMNVVRDVSQWRDVNGKPRDNQITWQSFAKILGLLPSSTVSQLDLDLVPIWLTGPFDNSVVAQALATRTIRKFLTSIDPDDWVRASRLLYHLTAIVFVEKGSGAETTTPEVQTIIKDYWLKELVKATTTEFGKKAGREAADIFLARTTDVFAHTMGGRDSWLFRPAIEDHEQNYEWRGPYNRFVEGLRDTVLAWLDADINAARQYVASLLVAGVEIVERIGIHILDRRFDVLRDITPRAISPTLFDAGHLHELYHFLGHHFQNLNDEERAEILRNIQNLPTPDRGNDSERIRLRNQQNWLKSIAGKGYEPVDSWLGAINEALGDPANFVPSDFNSYRQMRWGSGPTPHTAEELVALARAGKIIEVVNSFTPSNSWEGPSTRSLSDALIEAVGIEPDTFLDQLSQFLDAKPEYQYSVIAGYKKLWDARGEEERALPWRRIWPKLIDFFEAILTNDEFWEGKVDNDDEQALSPTRQWIPPEIAEFLRAGTRNDEKAYAPELLPRTLRLVEILLDKSEPQAEPREGDALNGAINTDRGKALEALFDHALRLCRLSDKAEKSHVGAWRELEPLFDAELAKCRDGNFEFSALAGAYIANLHYMNSSWVHKNITAIFPIEYARNCLAALDGFAYAPSIKPVFDELVAAGVVDWALRKDIADHLRERLLQRLGLSYLWGDEQLDGPRFGYLFENRRFDDLDELARYFWMVRGEQLTQEQTERIFQFWDHTVAWGKSLSPPPARLFSRLSQLSCYLSVIDQRARSWLTAVAPFVQVDYNADDLIEQLGRLANTNPTGTAEVLGILLETYQPSSDYKDRLKKLIEQLGSNPVTRSDAILMIEKIRDLPGAIELYSRLTSGTAVVLE
jgi:hypothetical protein